MKKRAYDFSGAVMELEQWYKPSELSLMLKNAALELAPLAKNREGDLIACMQIAVMNACNFLDAIKETEVEQ